jgi:hypothetical protein
MGPSVAGTAIAIGLVESSHVVGVADSEVQPGHAVLDRHRRVEGGRPGVVAAVDSDPGDPRGLRLLDGGLRGEAHHHVAHAVVAVDERHPRGLAGDADLGFDVDRSALDAPDVLRQPEDAVAVGAEQVGARHQLRAGRGVLRGKADGEQGLGNEANEARGWNACRGRWGRRLVPGGHAANPTMGRKLEQRRYDVRRPRRRFSLA